MKDLASGMISVVMVLVFTLLAGCATSFDPAGSLKSEPIPVLEARVAETPNSVPDLVRLGRALRQADRVPEALSTLESARQVEPLNTALVAELGLTYEAAERPDMAREAATLDPGFQNASIRAGETERASEVSTDAPPAVTGEPVATDREGVGRTSVLDIILRRP